MKKRLIKFLRWLLKKLGGYSYEEKYVRISPRYANRLEIKSVVKHPHCNYRDLEKNGGMSTIIADSHAFNLGSQILKYADVETQLDMVTNEKVSIASVDILVYEKDAR